MTHRFIVLVADEDAEKLNRWASKTTLYVRGGFPVLEGPVHVVGLIDNGKEPTDEELEESLLELETYDERLAAAFRADLATGNVDRLSAFRALKQFARTRKRNAEIAKGN